MIVRRSTIEVNTEPQCHKKKIKNKLSTFPRKPALRLHKRVAAKIILRDRASRCICKIKQIISITKPEPLISHLISSLISIVPRNIYVDKFVCVNHGLYNIFAIMNQTSMDKLFYRIKIKNVTISNGAECISTFIFLRKFIKLS